MTALSESQIPDFLFPNYLHRSSAAPLVQKGLIALDHADEEYHWTNAGRREHEALRERYGMTWDAQASGGGRWVVAGRALHCGDVLEVMLGDGTWKKVRFEVAFTGKPNTTGGRVPVLYLALAGGSSLECNFPISSALFRWSE